MTQHRGKGGRQVQARASRRPGAQHQPQSSAAREQSLELVRAGWEVGGIPACPCPWVFLWRILKPRSFFLCSSLSLLSCSTPPNPKLWLSCLARFFLLVCPLPPSLYSFLALNLGTWALASRPPDPPGLGPAYWTTMVLSIRGIHGTTT